MPTALHTARIVRFVREVLGCACPDEVFRDIVWQSAPVPEADNALSGRLLIGGRLVIDILRADTVDCAQACLPGLLDRGKAFRDGHGFNRWRLLVVVPAPNAAQALQACFARLSQRDARTHLHVLAEEALAASGLPGLLAID